MTKKEFMKKLKRLLPEKDRKDILLDYEEHFLTGLNEGKTEEQIAEELGDPADVAREYGYVQGKMPTRNIIFAAIGIILFDLFIGISLVSTLISVWLSLWAAVLAMLVGSVALIIGSVLAIALVPLPWYVLLFAGISLLGFTALSGIGMIYVSKWFYKAIKWFVELHVKIFTNK